MSLFCSSDSSLLFATSFKNSLCTIFIFSIVFFLSGKLLSQNLDSLYNSFLYLKGKADLIDNTFLQNYTPSGKCGLGIITEVRNNLSRFSPERQSILNVLLTRPALQKSFVTGSGFFRVSAKPRFETSCSLFF